MKKILFLFAFYLILFALKAQENRADRLFNKWNYAKASTAYQKRINRKPSADLYYRLGQSYRKMSSHFRDEEAAFSKVDEFGTYSDPNYYLEYARTLRTNGKIPEAKVQLDKYMSLKPGDSKGLFLKNSIVVLHFFKGWFPICKGEIKVDVCHGVSPNGKRCSWDRFGP